MRRPQTLVANLLFERVDDSAPLVVKWQEFATGKQHLQGLHLVANELADPVELFGEIGFGREVPRHVDAPRLFSGDPLRPAAPRLRSPSCESESGDSTVGPHNGAGGEA